MKSLLKFITCGSVDDGKSTLIGHLLYDAKLIYTDHEQALELDSRLGSREGKLDYSLLLDGLIAEREQGITIDVAYRYFTTQERSFIVADCPGHEQYTRNMAVGAAFADLAVILVDTTHGVSMQTKRHTRICALMGIRHIVLAVNKIDLFYYDSHRFHEISRFYKGFATEFDFDSIQIIPVSATEGDNIVHASPHTQWYTGDPLLSYLEHIDVSQSLTGNGFIMPVQRVSRPHHGFRGFQGQIESGHIAIGDRITVLPGNETAHVKQVLVAGDDRPAAVAGQAVSIQLDREVDVSRGCVLVGQEPLELADQFTADVLWMDEAPLVPGRNYLIKCGAKELSASVTHIKHMMDIETGNHIAVEKLLINEIGCCDIALSENMVFTAFNKNHTLGRFILIDRVTNSTAACGVIRHALRRATNITWQHTDITREIRARQKEQQPRTIWFTGLSGSGKSVLANELEKRLVAMGKHTMLLDGDNIRHGLNKNLGFTESDRVENIRRIAEVARLMNEAGLIVLTAFISPFRQDRDNARQIIGSDTFVEIYVSTPLEVCEQRDVKGLYRKARNGEIPNFTGISSPYEAPVHPEFSIDTSKNELSEAADMLLHLLKL